MTKEIHKRLSKIEANLGDLELSEPNEETVRTVKAKDPNLARKLRIAILDARGDFETAIGNLSLEELRALVEILAPEMAVESEARK